MSHNVLSLNKKINNRKIDFLFIDGDHTYKGVKKDFEMYKSFVSEDGIIALHDIALHPPETNCKVHEFWNEIKNNYNYQEIVENKNQGWAGIGIVWKNYVKSKI